jgi:hypothetical protein
MHLSQLRGTSPLLQRLQFRQIVVLADFQYEENKASENGQICSDGNPRDHPTLVHDSLPQTWKFGNRIRI